MLIDLEHVGLKNFSLKQARGLNDFGSIMFPYTQYKVVLFGFGSFANAMLQILKHVLPKNLIDNVETFGTDRT